MVGALRKTMMYLGIAEDDHSDSREDSYAEYDDEYEYEDERDDSAAEEAPIERTAQVTPLHRGTTRVPGGSSRDLRRITTVHPRSYNEAKVIGSAFRAGTPVIMNLSELSDIEAKRLVDFGAGLIFGLHGTIERVTNKVFLLSPAHVEVLNEAHSKEPSEPSFFNQD